jgi:hypothetical protein
VTNVAPTGPHTGDWNPAPASVSAPVSAPATASSSEGAVLELVTTRDRASRRSSACLLLARFGAGFVFIALGIDKVLAPAGWTTFIRPRD